MIDEKKFADEAMSDEELDNVAGGTLSQMLDLYSAIIGIQTGSAGFGDFVAGAACAIPGLNAHSKSEVIKNLSFIGINAEIDIG